METCKCVNESMCPHFWGHTAHGQAVIALTSAAALGLQKVCFPFIFSIGISKNDLNQTNQLKD